MTRPPLLVALALGLLLTAGCGGDDPVPRAASAPSPSVSVSVSPKPSPSPREKQPEAGPTRERRSIAAETEPPEPTGNALTIERAPVSHLIGAGVFGAAWSVQGTGGEAGRMTSDCQRATLRDIGAMDTRVRDFSTEGSAAVQAVSRFGDAKSAWRAEQVVFAWREDCADELRGRGAALGTVRHGAWLSVVEVTGVSQPHRRLRAALAAVDATF